MIHLKNNDGFTLISTLLIMILLATFLPLLAQLTHASSYQTSYDELSIQHFFLFLRDELFVAMEYSVKSDELILDFPDDKKVHILKVGDNIVRRVSGGYEVFLRDIQKIWFVEKSESIQVYVTLLEGEQYEKIFPVFKNKQ